MYRLSMFFKVYKMIYLCLYFHYIFQDTDLGSGFLIFTKTRNGKKITGLEKYPLNMNLKTMALITGKEIWQPIMTQHALGSWQH